MFDWYQTQLVENGISRQRFDIFQSYLLTNATTMKSIFGSPIFMQSTLVIWIMKGVWVLFFIMLDWTKSNGWNCCFMYMHWYFNFFFKKNQFQYLENWFWIKCFLPFVLNHVNFGWHVSCVLLFCWIYKKPMVEIVVSC